MKKMIYIGVDPGQEGAIAVIDEDAELLEYKTFKNWKTEYLYLRDFDLDKPFACIEKLHGMPIRGCKGNFSLGGNYTAWKAIFEILEFSYTEVPPQTWQRKILNTAKKKARETKPLAIEYVNKRFPDLNFEFKRAKDIEENSGVADAICIALYGRYVVTNKLIL